MLRSSDLYVLVGLAVNDDPDWTLRGLAGQLRVDHTLVYRALERADAVGLYLPRARAVNVGELEQLLVYAARFIAPVKLGELVAGVPAAWAAEPIASLVRQSGDDPPPVWPSATGRVRGQALEPLHPAAVAAAAASPALAQLLAVIDALRTRDNRLRAIAEPVLRPLLAGSVRPNSRAA